VLNLDHGWTSPTPVSALDTLTRGARTLEGLPAEHLPGIWERVSNTTVRRELAAATGVPPAEIALVRNATEALNTVLLGLPLKAGDEVVCSPHDYYAMLDALEQRRARDGIVLRMVELPVPATSLDALAQVYEAAIGPRTLLPMPRLAAAARRVGAFTVVDGAQSLGLLEDPVQGLDCDFYGASAHKWLGLAVGTGVLWTNRVPRTSANRRLSSTSRNARTTDPTCTASGETTTLGLTGRVASQKEFQSGCGKYVVPACASRASGPRRRRDLRAPTGLGAVAGADASSRARRASADTRRCRPQGPAHPSACGWPP